jgi:aminoglycoside phosphotransferase (APT) family kinase protein
MPIPQQRDLALTRTALARWLGRRVRAADVAVANLRVPAATGYSNDTLLFDATWSEDGERRSQGLVARIRPSGYLVFPEVDVALQYRVMGILRAHTDVPVPPVHWLETDDSILGAPFYVMGLVEGQIPSDNPPYTMEGFVHDATPAQRDRLYRSGLEAMARVHRVDWQRLGFGFLDRPADGRPGLDQQLSYYERFYEWAARGRPQPVAQAAWEWIKAHVPGEDEPLRLCWGDSRISNEVFSDFECMAVLDWEMVTLGNPEQDLAWWIFLDRHFTEGLGLARPEGFLSYDETVTEWERLTGLECRHLRFYEVFAGFRFAVIMMRLAQMMITYEVIPPDSDLETNNIVTRLLATMLEVPAPG